MVSRIRLCAYRACIQVRKDNDLAGGIKAFPDGEGMHCRRLAFVPAGRSANGVTMARDYSAADRRRPLRLWLVLETADMIGIHRTRLVVL
jgi:hypothetical protein